MNSLNSSYALVSKKTLENNFTSVSISKIEPHENFSGWVVTSSIEEVDFSEEDLIPIETGELLTKLVGFQEVMKEGQTGDRFVYNKGFESLVKLDRRITKNISSEALASNQGLLKVNFIQWFKYNKQPLQQYLLLVVMSVGFLILLPKPGMLHLICLGSIGYAIWKIYEYTLEIRETYIMGNVLPGIVVSTTPLLIATFTDLTKGLGEYPAIRVDHFPSFQYYHKGKVKKGDRIPMLAVYQHLILGPPLNYWNNFTPWPVEFATKDRELLGKKYYSIAEEEWLSAEAVLTQVNTQKVGLSSVNIQTTAWKDEQNIFSP